MKWPWVRRAQERQRLEARLDGLVKELARWRKRVKDLEQKTALWKDAAGSLIKRLNDENARLLERIDGHHTAIKALEDRGLPVPSTHNAITDLQAADRFQRHRIECLDARITGLEVWRDNREGDDK